MYQDMPVRKRLKLIYSLVKPKYAIPVHGEYRHLKAQRRCCEEPWNSEGECIYYAVR